MLVPRVSVSVPETAPPPTVTLLAVIWKVQGLNVMLFGASGPWVKFKVQDPKVALPLDVAPPLVVKVNVGGLALVKVSVTWVPARLGSKITPFEKTNGCPTRACTLLPVTFIAPVFTLGIVCPLVTVPPPSSSSPPQPTSANALTSAHITTR